MHDNEAVVSWLSAEEFVTPADGGEQRPWTTVVVDVLAAVMRGEYAVEEHYRGKHWVKTRIVDVADPEQHRHLGTSGSLLWSWLPWPGAKRVEQKRLDFGLRES